MTDFFKFVGYFLLGATILALALGIFGSLLFFAPQVLMAVMIFIPVSLLCMAIGMMAWSLIEDHLPRIRLPRIRLPRIRLPRATR